MKRLWAVLVGLVFGVLAGKPAVAVPTSDTHADTTMARAADTTAHHGIFISPDSVLALPGLETSTTPELRHMQDTVTVMRGITVDATRAREPSRATQTTTRIDKASLARFLPSTPTDAMVAAPGVDMVKTGPWASRVSFRGFQGERVLVMVDGVRLNTGRGHGANTSLVSVDRLDEVELSAGSGGAEYGSDAVGGVINLVTHRPLFADQPAVTLTLGARAATPGGEAAQSERLKLVSKHFGAELSVGAGHLQELVTPVEHVPNSGSRDEDWGARGAAKLGAATLDLEHTRHAARDVGLPALDGSYPIISRDATRAELSTSFMASAFGWGVPSTARLLGTDQHYGTELNETTRDTVVSQRTHQPIAYHETFDVDQIATRSRGIQPEVVFGSEALRLGAELRREDTSGPKTTTVTTSDASGAVVNVAESAADNVPDSRRDVAAASASTRIDVSALRVELGARYDWLRSRADSTASSWSAPLDVTDRHTSLDGGLAWHSHGVEPYGRVASGFRAPNLEERYFRGPVHGGMLVYGDPSLVPETNITYEAGVRANADGWGSARLSAYRVYAEHFISLDYLGLFFGQARFQYANLDRVQIDGLEFTGTVRRSGGASLAVSATLPRGRDLASGERLNDIGVPRASIDATTPVGRWLPEGMFAVRARWSDAVTGDPLKPEQSAVLSRHAFWTLGAELAATIAGVRTTFAVRNLLDNHYREPLSFVDEPGRTFAFAVKRDFSMPLGTPRHTGRP